MSSMRSLFRPVSATTRTFSTSARNSYAKLAIIGRLAGAPEAHASSTGRTYLKYAIATSHGQRDAERTSWWNVTSFPSSDAQKDYLLNLPKGALVHLEADAEFQKYEIEGETATDRNGNEVQKTGRSLNLVQRSLEVLGRPKHQAASDAIDEPQAAAA